MPTLTARAPQMARILVAWASHEAVLSLFILLAVVRSLRAYRATSRDTSGQLLERLWLHGHESPS